MESEGWAQPISDVHAYNLHSPGQRHRLANQPVLRLQAYRLHLREDAARHPNAALALLHLYGSN